MHLCSLCSQKKTFTVILRPLSDYHSNETTQLRIGRRKVYRGKLGHYIEMINEPKTREGKKRRKVGHSASMLLIIL